MNDGSSFFKVPNSTIECQTQTTHLWTKCTMGEKNTFGLQHSNCVKIITNGTNPAEFFLRNCGFYNAQWSETWQKIDAFCETWDYFLMLSLALWPVLIYFDPFWPILTLLFVQLGDWILLIQFLILQNLFLKNPRLVIWSSWFGTFLTFFRLFLSILEILDQFQAFFEPSRWGIDFVWLFD